MVLIVQTIPSPKTNELSQGGLTAIVLCVVFSVIAIIAVGLRFWVRRMKHIGPLLEDWLILAALIVEWSYVAVVFLLAYQGGLGWPHEELTPDTQIRASKYSLAGQTNWPIANALIKTSICLAYIRIFFTRTFRIVATVAYSITICWALMTILVGFLICTPISRLFIKTGTGHCGSTNAAYLSISALDVVLDIVIFMLPVPSLRKLQVTSHTKVALGATFALGLFTVTAGAMRLVSVTKINFGMNMQGQLGTAYWSAIELAVGITVACLMNLRPLLDLMLTSIKQYSSKARLSTKSRQKDMNQSSAPVSGDSENADFFTRLPEIEFLPLRPNRQGHRDVAIIGLRAGSSEGPVSFLDF